MTKESWTFNGVELSQYGKWDIEEVIEGIGVPKYRGSNLQVPFQHGTRWIKKRYDRRKVVFSMWIKGRDRAELDQHIDQFIRGIAKPGIHTLRRSLRSGEIRESLVELSSELNFVRKGPGYAKFALELELLDPFFYGTESVSVMEEITDENHTWAINNSGTAPVVHSRIIFEGPLNSPVLMNKNNGVWIQFLGQVYSGESVVLDTKSYTCLKGELNVISSIKHGGDPYWMILEAGENILELETNIIGGGIAIEYYPAFY